MSNYNPAQIAQELRRAADIVESGRILTINDSQPFGYVIGVEVSDWSCELFKMNCVMLRIDFSTIDPRTEE